MSRYALTKTKFCSGLQCPKKIWLEKNRKDLIPPVTPEKQQIFDQGTEVGIRAQKDYPGGVLVEFDQFHAKEAIAYTNSLLKKTPAAIFEAAFSYKSVLIRVDILKHNDDGTWDLIEVKSSTKAKDEHIPDLAIQRYVLEGCGIAIKNCILRHINSNCIFPNLDNLFTDSECNSAVEAFMPTIEPQLHKLKKTLDEKKEPKVEIGLQCNSPYECDLKPYCWKDIPEHSVFELQGVWNKTKFELYRNGIVKIKDIPIEMKVSRAKKHQIDAVKDSKAIIDKEGLSSFLNGIEFPVYYLDFETINSAIPQFIGTKPFEQVPFQFSCHIQMSEEAEVTHQEFLADGSGDPRTELCKALLTTIGPVGSIIAYNAKFEIMIIKTLAGSQKEYQNQLMSLTERFVDLEVPFKKYFYHPGFRGSTSIKAVLPVLVPKMGYSTLEIYNGVLAQIAFKQILRRNLSRERSEQLGHQLVQYCKQDTSAMVRILIELKSILDS